MIDTQKQQEPDKDQQKLEQTRDTLQRLLNKTTLERQTKKQKKIAEIPVEEYTEEPSLSQQKNETPHPNSPSSSSDYSETKKGKMRKRTSPKVSSKSHSSDEAEEE